MNFALTTLGTSAAGPIPGRWASAQYLRVGNRGCLLDCAEGTQIVLQQHGIGWSDIDVILISHLHGDHIFGLPGLLSSWALHQRNRALTIVAPSGLEETLAVIFTHSRTVLPYPIHWVTALPDATPQQVFATPRFEITTLPLAHRIPSVGYCVRELPLPRTILPEALLTHNIPTPAIRAIKAGGDYTAPDGSIVPNTALTTDPPPPRAFAYCSDTTPLPAVVPLIYGVDLLYHEATFTQDQADNALATGHSTAQQAATIAREAHVKELVIGHFSHRYGSLFPLLDEARLTFPATHLAEEGRVFDIPYRGRGKV